MSIAPRYGLFIGGEFVPPAADRYFATLNPATEEPLAEVATALAALTGKPHPLAEPPRGQA